MTKVKSKLNGIQGDFSYEKKTTEVGRHGKQNYPEWNPTEPNESDLMMLRAHTQKRLSQSQ